MRTTGAWVLPGSATERFLEVLQLLAAAPGETARAQPGVTT
jgi:hypothetical protein